MRKWYSLIDKVYSQRNLHSAYKQVRRNNGAPGIDGMSVKVYGEDLADRLNQLSEKLKAGDYIPQNVRRVMIPKADGRERPLGIPTVEDRIVQQAIVNILEPIFEPSFHSNSYGYRKGKSCQHAVAKADELMQRGLTSVLDMDLSKCFDTLSHEIILKCLNVRISDGKLLNLIANFLKSGVMYNGKTESTDIGSPQGGVISPLLMNIYLNHFDQYMRRNGVPLVRYADDILLFASHKQELGRIRKLAFDYLEGNLQLIVNQEKTKLREFSDGIEYLGFIITPEMVRIHPKRIKTLKDKVRSLTKRTGGGNLAMKIHNLNPLLRGWANYFRFAKCASIFRNLMSWIRRRLRMCKMREWKRWKALHRAMRRRGYKGHIEKISMRRWRNAGCYHVHYALPNSFFDELGLYNMEKVQCNLLHLFKQDRFMHEPYTRSVRTVL